MDPGIKAHIINERDRFLNVVRGYRDAFPFCDDCDRSIEFIHAAISVALDYMEKEEVQSRAPLRLIR